MNIVVIRELSKTLLRHASEEDRAAVSTLKWTDEELSNIQKAVENAERMKVCLPIVDFLKPLVSSHEEWHKVDTTTRLTALYAIRSLFSAMAP